MSAFPVAGDPTPPCHTAASSFPPLGDEAAAPYYAERFWSKVNRYAPEGECWPWISKIDRYGYGVFLQEGRERIAHRVAFELTRGPIPEGLTIDHLCRVRHCVNPAHLEPVTNRENLRRGIHGGGIPRGYRFAPRAPRPLASHCGQGHEFTPENTMAYLRSDTGRPGRTCRECHRLKLRRYRVQRKAREMDPTP